MIHINVSMYLFLKYLLIIDNIYISNLCNISIVIFIPFLQKYIFYRSFI
ncbi:hypothetical protein CTDIVETGP_0686 [Clostridium tyrobutyricum DIVETGP]|uniref:Uncharacterized protein n=1 Tax=Clostridium tyrobutyricum DIVETGP TaxID=1408889 RepID=W6N3E9_CLOTY|nr:hypothetical protein CTK_C08080 [Clostridium tyrobutyricum]CDL90616.1 hypothetical protein CTDIVETGP_0686 [Clostridium tyrobutyricum DIVETGP]